MRYSSSAARSGVCDVAGDLSRGEEDYLHRDVVASGGCQMHFVVQKLHSRLSADAVRAFLFRSNIFIKILQGGIPHQHFITWDVRIFFRILVKSYIFNKAFFYDVLPSSKGVKFLMSDGGFLRTVYILSGVNDNYGF